MFANLKPTEVIDVGDKIIFSVKKRNNFYNLRAISRGSFEECSHCDAPTNDSNAQCNGCNEKEASKIKERVTIVDNRTEDFEYGEGQILEMKTRKNKLFKANIFSSSPLYKQAKTIKAGEKIKISGWSTNYGDTEWVKVFAMKK